MRMPWAFIAACCLGMFAATASGSSRAPFLIDMGADLGVSLPMIANLFGVTSVAWGLSSFVAGRGSDIWGRRPLLIGGPIGLAMTLSAVALSGSYWSLLFWVTLAGCCCGTFTAVAMAEVSIRADDSQRGRALGWVMSGQSLTLLIGVPMAAWIGASVGWRGVHYCIAVLALLAALATFSTTGLENRDRKTKIGEKDAAPKTSLKSALTPPIIRLFIGLVAERVCFGLSAFYYPAFLRTTYDLGLKAVALPLMAFAVGNILGTILGGQLADRISNRQLNFAVTLLISGFIALIWFSWQPGLLLTVALGFAFALTNALGRPSLMAALATVPADVRGTVMGLNSTIASIGWLTAALVGGWLYAGIGFAGFGPLMLTLALLGAAITVAGRRILSTEKV